MGSCVGRNGIFENCLLNNRPGQFIKLNNSQFYDIYDKGSMLGMSQIGDVFDAVHKITRKSFGVKIVDESQTGNREIIKKIMEILIDSDHPGIVKCIEYFREQNQMYLVMDKCTGGSLAEKLEYSIRLDENTASIICQRLLSVVYYLHQHKISHRSIKPEFILFQERENYSDVKLVFLTKAASFTENTRFSEIIGQEEYNSPEMLLQDYNEKCDLWSIGVLLYQMLSGKLPFSDIPDSPRDHHIKLTSTGFSKEKMLKFDYSFKHEVWSTISDKAKDLIAKLLCPENERISALVALQFPWISEQDNIRTPPRNIINKILENLSSYKSEDKFRDAISGISASILSEYDTRYIRRLFQYLDTDGDGKLSQEEFINGFGIQFNIGGYKKRILQIMRQIDTDKNGFIDFYEFLKASIGKTEILTESNLKNVFDKIDIGRVGKLSLDDFINTFSRGPEDTIDWGRFIEGADHDRDSRLNFEEFVAVVNEKFRN